MSGWWTAVRALGSLLVMVVDVSAPARSAEILASGPPRLKIELDGTVTAPTWFAMTGPDRLVVDLPGGRARSMTSEGHGEVGRVRLAQFNPKTARLVIELTGPARIDRALADNGSVVVILAPTTAADFARLPRMGRFRADAPALTLVASADVDRDEPQRSKVDLRPLVVIDPGHGGKDVGAISAYQGRFEKDATLAIAKAIKRDLERDGRVRARLTRDDDRFIELGERVAIARRAEAALFLSVHCDSAPNAAAHGATVYTLSDVASDKMAARAAARENRADTLSHTERDGEEPEVANVLYDLTRRGAMNASAGFAESLQRAMQSAVEFTGNYHRFAGFRVLKTADMPAALLETGYLTNEDDARFLFSTGGQRAIARGVRMAVEAQLLPRPIASVARGVESNALDR